MNANLRNFALWVIIFLLVLALVTLFQSPAQKSPNSEIMFSQLLSEVDGGHVRDVTISGPEISGHYKDGHAFQTYAPSDPELSTSSTTRASRSPRGRLPTAIRGC